MSRGLEMVERTETRVDRVWEGEPCLGRGCSEE